MALIGHRGVGKTSLLQRLAGYFPDALCLDLDGEIERQYQTTVSEIFQREGEARFRDLECDVFNRLQPVPGRKLFVALGAGFDPAQIRPTWTAIWVRRPSDSSGRIFTDRPRLNQELSELEEYRQRHELRQPRFAARADRVLWLDEGADQNAAERAFFSNELHDLGGTLTLLPENFRRDFAAWYQVRASWGCRWFEIRDDLLNTAQMVQALSVIPAQKILISHRDRNQLVATQAQIVKLNCPFDWPLEWGPCPYAGARFLSLHQRRATIAETLRELERVPLGGGQIFKIAIEVRDFVELAELHAWQKAQPDARVILPSSTSGRWRWYRQLRSRDQALGFLRESDGSSADQPTILDAARLMQTPTAFAAVLGDPVEHSRTPAEQRSFFSPDPVLAIRIAEHEWATALPLLEHLGLRWAAVTSPLKRLALQTAVTRDPLSTQLGAANTLCLVDGAWSCTNTDFAGLRAALQGVPIAGAALWGGGGTLGVVQACVPGLMAFAARTGESRSGGAAAVDVQPTMVIWAVGRSNHNLMPPTSWRPALVFDLNYAENSPGREYALRVGAKYLSGAAMFSAQAAAQRMFWEKSK